MTDPVTSATELLPLLLREGKRRIVLLTALFSVAALATLGLGALLPKQYESHVTLRAESKSIIEPLMAGRAVQSAGSDDAQLVRQAFLTRRVLREIVAAGGWTTPDDPIEELRVMDRVAKRITIQSPRRELVKISYRDTDPRRCYAIASKLAEIYIRESTLGREGESREAFQFIEKQVSEYAAQAEEAHAKVLAYQRHLDAKRAAATSAAIAAADAARARRAAASPRLSPEQVAALTAEESSLAGELASLEARQGRQARAERIAQLERELATLLTSFTENHPNVVRAREELRRQQAEADRAFAVEDEATRPLRARLEQVRRQLRLASQPAPSPGPALAPAPVAADETAPELRGVGQDSTLSELVRRYEATRQVYQDLLVRRENARVSMELEAQRSGESVRVYEPAEVPLIATGLRLMHFSLIGLVLAVLLPLGLLFALLRFDPRVRTGWQLERATGLPLLVGIPYAPTLSDRLRQRRRALVAGVMVVGVFAAYAAFFVVKVKLAP
jgi:polysaccharide chain length determinant protein (PEP-CTERM system associated)